jgi:chromosome partitioning protein
MTSNTPRRNSERGFVSKPIKIVISNQRGGVAKTTTTLTMARYLADTGMKVLVVDTDPQGSITPLLGLRPTANLFDFLIRNFRFEECLTKAHPNIDVICSARSTTDAEHHILTQVYREFVFEKVFTPHETGYDAILVDVAPSISLLQTCAMIYCRRVLIPVAMETLSLQGCSASINAASILNTQFRDGTVNVQTVGILPVMVNPRLQMTDLVMSALKQLSEAHNVPILPSIRQDVEVVKAAKTRKFLIDHAPASRGLADYNEAMKQLLEYLDSGKEYEHQQAS